MFTSGVVKFDMAERYRQAPGTTAEQSGERVVVLDAGGQTITTLNPTGAAVWGTLASPASVEDLAAALQAQHPDVDRQDLRRDAAAFVAQLLEAELIVVVDAER